MCSRPIRGLSGSGWGDNLRYDQWDEQVSEEAVEAGTLTIPHAEDIRYLWHFAKHLQAEREAVRGRPEVKGKIDWFFDLEGEGEDAIIHVKGAGAANRSTSWWLRP